MDESTSHLNRIIEGQYQLEIDKSLYSPGALERFKEKIDQYALELGHEARRIANSRQAEIISTSYVNEASRRLFSSGYSRLARLIGLVGSVLFGAGFSGIINVTQQHRYSAFEVILYFSLGVIGAMATVFQILKE